MADEKKATKATAKKDLTDKQKLELMDKLKVDVLYKNHKGEYFVSENFANLSLTAAEKKEGKKVAKVERSTLKSE